MGSMIIMVSIVQLGYAFALEFRYATLVLWKNIHLKVL